MKRILVLGMLLALALTTFGTPVSAKKSSSEWSAPVNLGPAVNTAGMDSCPCIARDGLSLYYASSRAGFGIMDLYVSQRTSTDQPWDVGQNLGPTINTDKIERCMYVTPDGHYLIFVSDNRPDGKGSGDFYISYRRDKKDDFGWEQPRNISEINSEADVYAMWGYEEHGLLKLYFGSKASSAPGDIYSTTMAKDGTFSRPEPVSELNTEYHESFPVVSKDGLEIFFNSVRPGGVGGVGATDSDIWASTRQKTSDQWSTPVNLGPAVNSKYDDSRAALSWDGSTIIFTSTRPGGSGSWDLWTATRSSQKPRYTFTTIDPPGAKGAWAYDVGPGGQVVGNYQTADNKWHGFLLRGGEFTTLDYPRNDVTMIRPGGIAPSGDIAGFYTAGGILHGFVLTRDGEWSTVDCPGQPNSPWMRILPDGTLIGNHFPVGGADTGDMRAVVMSRSGNTELELPCTTYIGGTPDGKVLVGYYKEGPLYTFPYHAYVIDNGVFTGFVFPGSGWYCAAWDVSPDGSTIVGTFHVGDSPAVSVPHGYIAERRGDSVDDWTFTQFDVPGAVATCVYGCNSAGDLVGTYKDASGRFHGFLASRSGGK